jgi:hypothetical protein
VEIIFFSAERLSQTAGPFFSTRTFYPPVFGAAVERRGVTPSARVLLMFVTLLHGSGPAVQR